MGEFPRKSDGRRTFTVEFKRGVVQQLLKGEKTLAEVSRELDIQPERRAAVEATLRGGGHRGRGDERGRRAPESVMVGGSFPSGNGQSAAGTSFSRPDTGRRALSHMC